MSGPLHPGFGRSVSHFWKMLAAPRYTKSGLFSADSNTANQVFGNIKRRVLAGETCYIVGLGISGHNSGTSLVQVSQAEGIQLLPNDEEERFTGVKHYEHFPKHATSQLRRRLESRGVRPDDVATWATSWDYCEAEVLGVKALVEQLPKSFNLLRPGASPMWITKKLLAEARLAPGRLREQLGLETTPSLIMLPHHENHASFAYAASPFAKNDRPTMITVVDGAGDRGSISHYIGEAGRVTELYCNDNIFDSLGLFYTMISSTQGGWAQFSSEGRYMGAVAWGDQERLTNPFYKRLREIFHFGSAGKIVLNQDMANWQNAGEINPYTPAPEAIIGTPIPPHRLWNPDAVLNVDSIEHSNNTRARVDLAAATQLVFEDGIFHIVGHLIRSTGSDQLVLSGGTALNGLANMRLLQHFDRKWYKDNLAQDTRLKLWVPPTVNDTGVTIGAAYSTALRAEVPCGPSLKHAAYCGIPAENDEIQQALANEPDIEFLKLGSIQDNADRRTIADLMAFIIERNGVLGLYQGPAETGPRALGQRSILANPCNPDTRQVLNERVKFREAIRPLAPMVTGEQAATFFELSDGAAADEYNAYRYMVLTTMARPIAYEKIPAVVHKDGTARIQIVTFESNPLVYDYLQAMGRRVGAEVSCNTSLNVGGPICQTPAQALATMKRAKGLTGLVMVSADGEASLVWHAVETEFKDGGGLLSRWVADHATESVC